MTGSQVDFTDSAHQGKFDCFREQLSGKTLSSPPSIDAGTEFCTVAIDR